MVQSFGRIIRKKDFARVGFVLEIRLIRIPVIEQGIIRLIRTPVIEQGIAMPTEQGGEITFPLGFIPESRKPTSDAQGKRREIHLLGRIAQRTQASMIDGEREIKSTSKQVVE